MMQHATYTEDDALAAVDCQDSYHQYLASISPFPPLTDAQDAALLHRLAQVKRGEAPWHEGEAIVQRLIEGSFRLVVFLAYRYYRYLDALYSGYHASTLLDFIQAGNMVLVESAQRCLLKERTPEDFGAYAAACIRYRLMEHHRNAGLMSLSQDDYQDALQSGRLSYLYTPLSVDAPTHVDDDRPLADHLALPEEDGQESARAQRRREKVKALLATLPERERRIVRLRYGLDPDDRREHTYEEIGRRAGACAQTCRNIEQKSLQALSEGTTLRTSTDYYSASEASSVLGLSNTAFAERIQKGIVTRHYLSSTDQMGVYLKTDIDALAEECRHITQDYYTRDESAALLGVSIEAINKWARQGKITRRQLPGRDNYGGLYAKAEVDGLVKAREEAAQRFYTCEEAAHRLGISMGSMPRFVREGLLKRYAHPGLSREGYAKDEVDRLAHLRKQFSYDYTQWKELALQQACA